MLREAGHPVRGRARASPPASPRPPTPASRSPTASSPAASRSSPATRTRTSRRRRSTGPRWPRFPGTLVFYMGVRALPRIAERLIAERAARATSRPRWSSAARCPASARSSRRSPTSPSARRRRASARRRSRSSGRSPRCASDLAWLERRPLHGRTRRGHAGAGAGERARGAAARARRRRRRGARDPRSQPLRRRAARPRAATTCSA